MAWLDDHPPDRSQFRCPRRAEVSGVVVVHTAENVMDTVGPDTGAEGVAAFIQHRGTPGSYHVLVDSDSSLNLVRYECEAFHDATGSNPHSFGLSFACRTEDWVKMPEAKRDAFIENGAQAAADYFRYVRAKRGIVIPATRITRDESESLVPGFISHAQRDPARRTDPGQDFPWTLFLARFRALTFAPPAPVPPEDPMAAPYALWKFTDDDRVYHVAADAVGARHLDSRDTLAYDQALLRLGHFDDTIHEVTRTSKDGKWLADLLKDAGVPTT